MSEVRNLIQVFSSQFTKALNEKQIEKASALYKEFEVELEKLSDPIDEIAAELSMLARNTDYKMLTWWLSAAELHPSPKYLEALCAILQQTENKHSYESVIDVLQTIKDDRTIPCLERLLSLDIDYNAKKDLSIRVLIALGELVTAKAKTVIQNCLASPHQKVRDDARLVLRVLEQQDNSV